MTLATYTVLQWVLIVLALVLILAEASYLTFRWRLGWLGVFLLVLAVVVLR